MDFYLFVCYYDYQDNFKREENLMRKKIQTLIILSFVVFHSFYFSTILLTDNNTISPHGFDKEWLD